jgi:ubiquinone/menaquinone biosynthesis C-methylase UbiE
MKSETMMMKDARTYIPAAGRDAFLPFYDAVTKFMGADRARRILLDQADLRPGQRVLDIGCGTGTFAVLLKQLHPDIELVGLDPDPKALARAKRKAEASAVSLRFDQGFSDALPYPARSFDHVFSSYMFHHLEDDTQKKTLREVRRVLKDGGRLHLLDFVGPDSGSGNFLSRLLHAHDRLKNNSRIVSLMTEADLANPKKVGERTVLFGFARVAYYQAEC